jgi:hypothetical protein
MSRKADYKHRCRDPRTNQFSHCYIPPRGLLWGPVSKEAWDEQGKVHDALRAYYQTMAKIEHYASRGGAPYQTMARLAKRGKMAATFCRERFMDIDDDLALMYQSMPRRD